MGHEALLCMSNYHVWAHNKLLTALHEVTDADLQADVGLFFPSILATLNHMLVCEAHLWYPRFAVQISPRMALNQILETDRNKLFQQLQHSALRWQQFVAQLPEDSELPQYLEYVSSAGLHLRLPYAATLLHVFNHATHHRGQLTAALTSLGYHCPELDLVYALIEQQSQQC